MELKPLVDLLSSLFQGGELRRFLHFGPDGEQAVQAIEFTGPPIDVAYHCVTYLIRAGHIGPAFFIRLREERPRRARDIDAVERQCLGSTVSETHDTHVVTLVAAIAGQISAIDDGQIGAALGSRAPKSWLRLDLHALDPFAGAGSAWTKGEAEIRRKVQEHLRTVVLPSGVNHVSLFGLAPIPWLMALGYAFSETVQVRVFQRHRVPSTWSWQPDQPGLDHWQTRLLTAAPEAREVALLVSASAPVQQERVDAVLSSTDRATYTITLQDPKIDAVRTEAQLEEFGKQYRALLDEIEQRQRAVERIHVFAAAPVAVAIDCGRRILHNADPVIVAYHYVDRGYVRALELRP